eukprot:964561-Prorocentrum_minimum.AAC.1
MADTDGVTLALRVQMVVSSPEFEATLEDDTHEFKVVSFSSSVSARNPAGLPLQITTWLPLHRVLHA